MAKKEEIKITALYERYLEMMNRLENRTPSRTKRNILKNMPVSMG